MPMLLALGCLLVVLISTVVARRSRRRFLDSGDALRCQLRIRGYRSPIWPSLGRHWSRPMWVRWEDDVLIVRRGPGLTRAILLRTQTPEEGVHNVHFGAPRRCGSQPIGVVLKIWDGSRIEIAAPFGDRMALVGPYLAAAITDLPRAPVRRRRG